MTEMRKDESAGPDEPAIVPPGDAPPPDVASAARPAHETTRGGRTRSLALWAAGLLLVALLVVGSAPFWAPLLPWGAQPDAGRLAALEARVGAAEAARRDAEAGVARLEAQLKEQPATQAAVPSDAAPALAALAQRIDALERGTAAAGAASDTAPLHDALQKTDARLDDVEARLGRIAAAQSSDQGADRPLLAALAALSAALAGSSPFASELDSVTALAGGKPEVAAALEPLAAAAPTGIPSTALLAERFIVETAPALERAAAAAAAPEDASLGDRVVARMRSLVTIRRLDEDGAGGDAAAKAVARARTDVLHGDLAGAVAALKSLSGPPAQDALPWLALAERRLDAEGALAAVMRQVAGRLAQPAQTSSPMSAPTPAPAAAPAASEDKN